MSGKEGTLEGLALALGKALNPLAESLSRDPGGLIAQLGIALSPSVMSAGGVKTALNAVSAAMTDLRASIDALDLAINVDDSAGISVNGATSLTRLTTAISNLASLGNSLKVAVQADASLDAAQKLRVSQFAGELPKRLLDFAVIEAITASNSVLSAILNLAGIIDVAIEGDGAVDPVFPPHVTRVVRLDMLTELIRNPLEHFKASIGFGQPAFDGRALFAKLQAILDTRFERTTILIEPGRLPVFEAPTFTLALDGATLPPSLVVPVRFQSSSDVEIPVTVGGWTLTLSQKSRFPPGCIARLTPSGHVELVPPYGTASLSCSATLSAERKDRPFRIFAAEGVALVSAESASFKVSVEGVLDPGSSRVSTDAAFSANIGGGRVRLGTRGADGFIQKILSGFEIDTTFEVGVDFSLAKGLRFRGSSGLEIQLGAHSSLGPVSVSGLTLGLAVKDGQFPIAVTADLKGALGPLDITVIGVGADVTFGVVQVDKGNLGPLDLRVGFHAPHGVGLAMDAGGFKGGGFLSFDEERGEYAGALELDFCGMFSVKAIGLVNTKLPDGSPGFSLVIVIAAEFVPIQLSFGFTLNGIGGIFGLNRTICVQALADGIRTNAIKSILFPEDVIANITRIISDIKQFFPPQPDHFVIGPMAKLGWGTPSLITVELGLLLDLPNPMFAIVGVLKCVLPDEEAPLLRLQVNFIGVMDFEHGYLFFRADLYDSRLLVLQITGSMALLVSWGDEQTFALSVGGFHPDFRDFPSIPALPDGFRGMARIGISLMSGDNPRLKADTYFAITSNTVQFGAHVELYAAAAGFNIYGFLGYDVLFQFDPFRFTARLDGGIALREGTSLIAGISVSVQLSGPSPWDARGDASLTILFLEISVSFHVTWGDPPPAIPPATEDLLARLQGELADTRNWRAELPANNHLHVTVRKIEPPVGSELVVIHPAGVLTFSQRSLPLENYLIEKFGNRRPLADNKFKLDNANCNGTPLSADFQGIREQFAPGNFTALNDSDKLSRHSFEKLPSGFKLTATQDLQVSKPEVREVDYELTYLRKDAVERVGRVKMVTSAYKSLVKGSAVRQSPLAHQQTRPSLNAPPQPELPRESYAIADVEDLKSHLSEGTAPVLFATQAEAFQRQRELLASNPALAGRIQVVSNYELS